MVAVDRRLKLGSQVTRFEDANFKYQMFDEDRRALGQGREASDPS